MYRYAETAKAFLTLAILTCPWFVLITSQFTQLQLVVMSSQQNVQWNVLGVILVAACHALLIQPSVLHGEPGCDESD